jgi:hypothetical protein
MPPDEAARAAVAKEAEMLDALKFIKDAPARAPRTD